ncbi:hypothetical protein [Staphylococcus simulans]|uniref:hypothetical protein n=1 Tax=Staphylococcus simulans TaxID=1286 RepID=UPI000CD03352|nr:hypothetical protein [Staphylococcus simulans]PNZ40486.1 hypothetical protein CD112_13285 [Staphylococcus simulans]SQE74629.1 Uncharacterized conserved protein [Staphylococcus simulans]VED60503.1 Uncharacterized conserved protein [Staphylococcus simulans]
MFKQVFLYDGTPYLAFVNDEGEYDYPKEAWTEVAPPEGIYSPFYFNGDEWIGATKEEFEESLPKEELPQPSTSEIMMASAQMQIAESSFQLRDTQKQLAQSMLDIAEKDKRIKQLEQQQAQILLEIAEMKGEK